jgi:hypothetical protein
VAIIPDRRTNSAVQGKRESKGVDVAILNANQCAKFVSLNRNKKSPMIKFIN